MPRREPAEVRAITRRGRPASPPRTSPTNIAPKGTAATISGATLTNGTKLDLHTLLAQCDIDLGGDVTKAAQYFAVCGSGSNATLNFNPGSGGSAVAVLNGIGRNVSLSTLISHDMLIV